MADDERPMHRVLIRDVVESDLQQLFRHQLDPEATRMADFPARDWDAFLAHWRKLLADGSLVKKAIICDGAVVGNIVSWEDSGRREVGYWIDREHWGRGIATEALAQLVVEVRVRPLYAYVVEHNVGSIRVLEKCGFRRAEADEAESSDNGDYVVLVLD